MAAIKENAAEERSKNVARCKELADRFAELSGFVYEPSKVWAGFVSGWLTHVANDVLKRATGERLAVLAELLDLIGRE